MQVAAVLLLSAVSAMAQSSDTMLASAATTSSAAAAAASSSAAPTSAAAQPTSGGDTCTTAKGGLISIIQPLNNMPIAAGKNFTITWDLKSRSDEAFNTASIGFELLDASNPNNVVSLGTLVASANVAEGQINAMIPATTKIVKSYAVRSTYRDNGNWRYCFSPQFTITGLSQVVTTSAVASVAPTAAPATTSKSSAEVMVGSAFAAAAVLFAF
ncbi:hypothetical protein BJ741DRAFT_651177 [Chytriomyces cf. hyalinus JEL632]|nr:hypothetical protein BJ741DRAFT_651177 [Chytriomyces cf. hyalinus JEL632]